jgi:RNA polymerase sigma factor (sigma-70 family)
VNLALRQFPGDQAAMKNSPEFLVSFSVSELSREILAGNADAFEEFHQRYAARVYGLLMTLTAANDDLSRELLQTVMLRAARKFKPAADDEALWAWLATVARNALVDHLRREQRRSRREQNAQLRIVSDSPLATGDLTTALEQALAELDPDDQSLIQEFYFLERSQAAIAARSETTVKALQSRLARIRRRLKDIILQHKREHED